MFPEPIGLAGVGVGGWTGFLTQRFSHAPVRSEAVPLGCTAEVAHQVQYFGVFCLIPEDTRIFILMTRPVVGGF